MNKAFVLLYLICSYTCAVAQRSYILGDDNRFMDSLSVLIAQTPSDSIRCSNSYKLANLLQLNGRPDEAKPYFENANKLAEKFPYLRDASIFFKATRYLMSGDYEGYKQQLTLAGKNLKKYPTKNAYALRAMILQNLSIMAQLNDNEKEAMRMIVAEAMPLAKQSDNNELISSLYKSIGIIFMNYPDPVKADSYLAVSANYLESKDNGSPTLKESKVELYAILAENLVTLGNMHAAKQALDKAYAILKDFPESNLNDLYYCSECLYYYTMGQLSQAFASCEKGIKSSERHKDMHSMNRLKNIKYKILRSEKRYKESIPVLLELVSFPNSFVADKKNWYKELGQAYEQQGDLKNATHYYNMHIHLADSLHQVDFQKEIGQLEARFNKAENENKIRQLEAQKERMRLVNENNRLYYGIAGLVALLLAGSLLLFWLRANTQRKLAQEKAKNYQQSLLTLRNEKEIEIMQATISGEEIERKRIARDLHDGIGSLLSSLKMKLLKSPDSINALSQEEATQVAALLNRSISDLRQIAYNLVPETLLKLGLEKALLDLGHLLKTDQVNIILQVHGISNDIPQSQQMSIYRIVQELINNALKHSGCSEIVADCSQSDQTFLITVEDNGRGFDVTNAATKSGSGLGNLRNRVEAMSGTLQVSSSVSGGTAFNIELHL